LAISRNSIIILGLVAAFILGTLTANPIVEAVSPVVKLLTDSIFGLEPIKNEVEKTSLQNQLLLLDLPDFKTAIDRADVVGEFTSIAIGDDGLPVISYRDGTNADLKVAHCGNVACTSATLSTVDSADSVGRYTSIAIGDDGLPVISYSDSANDDLKVAHCGNVACTSATLSTVDSADSVGSFTSIAIGDDGLPVISHFDSTNEDLKVVHCNDLACSPP